MPGDRSGQALSNRRRGAGAGRADGDPRAPAHLRSNNGPDIVSAAVRNWCEESGTGTCYIDPGSPWQNGIVERFNGRLRDELLSSEIFAPLAEARLLVDRRRLHYNHRHIQGALGKLTPAAFAATYFPALPPLRLAALRRRRASRSWLR